MYCYYLTIFVMGKVEWAESAINIIVFFVKNTEYDPVEL